MAHLPVRRVRQRVELRGGQPLSLIHILAAAIVVYAVMMDRRTDVARYNRLSAGTTVAEPDAAKAPTAGDTMAS